MATASVIRTQNFTSSIGIEAKLNYTDGAYHNISNVLADLKYIGVNLIRAASLNSAGAIGGQNNYAIAAAAGVKFDLVVNGNASIASTLSQIDAFVVAHPGSVASIEGPNEISNSPITYNGLTGAAAGVAFQNALYSAATGYQDLAGIPIYSFSVAPTTVPSGGYNAASLHPYAWNGAEPLAAIQTAIATAPAGSATVITETGYSTLASWSSGVDAATQAKLLLNTLFDAAKLGVQKTYIYELLDAYADPTGTASSVHYGLFDLSNNPKPAAVALHNLMGILADTGTSAASFQTAALNYTVSNLATGGSYLTFEKSSGTYDIVLWNEPKIWDATTHSEVAAATVQETINFGVNVGQVKIYDPLTGETAVQTFTNVSQVTVGVTDHPIIVEVSNVGASASAAVAEISAATLSTSSSADVLTASADGQTLTSSAAHPVISGGAYNNVTLVAATRVATTLVAGTGYEVLAGGMAGKDTFVFQSTSTSSVSHPDLVAVFTKAKDVIDLSGLRPDTSQALSLVSQFDHHAGEVTSSYDLRTNITTVSVDSTGDGAADFALRVHGTLNTSGNFIL